jgi:hypothetical protein
MVDNRYREELVDKILKFLQHNEIMIQALFDICAKYPKYDGVEQREIIEENLDRFLLDFMIGSHIMFKKYKTVFHHRHIPDKTIRR